MSKMSLKKLKNKYFTIKSTKLKMLNFHHGRANDNVFKPAPYNKYI